MKKHTNNTLKLSTGILAGTLLAGCGGIEGVTGTSTEDVNEAVQNVSNTVSSYVDNITGKTKGTAISARFLDSAVTNLQYKSNTYNGSTGTNGNFTCASGEQVEFVIGSLSLGTSICQSVITPQTLAAPKTQEVVAQTSTNASGVTTSTGSTVQTKVGSILSTDDRVLNRVRLLMTLDTDSNPDNGITLPASTEQAKVTTSTLDFASTTFDNDVQAVLTAMTINGSLVTKAAAQAHFVDGSLATLVKTDTNYSLNTGSYDEYDETAASNNNDDNENDDNENDNESDDDGNDNENENDRD
ncbi:hypothetical protein CYQ88_10485 [Hydrogenovibrio sp. SC-1]|uniref:hypothetical protein n=1 Tax=Hydrogenovibrio sp. SC-1 TaxID=2065820 RepID=UPI000C7E7E55|nr:hypothetical protein [Hydrogenovibrio sp. SC-1]PLA73565.1 hypothetical protein CYQ88_10485 [Hydrogenovibrio sp. SC-1]